VEFELGNARACASIGSLEQRFGCVHRCKLLSSRAIDPVAFWRTTVSYTGRIGVICTSAIGSGIVRALGARCRYIHSAGANGCSCASNFVGAGTSCGSGAIRSG
jgi:hypothetical protein